MSGNETPDNMVFLLPEDIPPERAPVEDIYKQKLKDRVDPTYRLQNHLKRCNILASRGDFIVFESAVQTLISILPHSMKITVKERIENECTIIPPVIWKYLEYCGHRLGTIDDPYITNDPDSVGYDPDKTSDPISPYKAQPEPYIDYMKVYDIINEELEFGGGSWRYDKALKEMGSKTKLMPTDVKEQMLKTIIETITEHREDGISYSWSDLLATLQKEQPSIPAQNKWKVLTKRGKKLRKNNELPKNWQNSDIEDGLWRWKYMPKEKAKDEG